MLSNRSKYAAVVWTISCFCFSITGCGGGEPAPAPAANSAADAKPKAPPVKGKGGQLIESEDNTPANFRD
jgi:hypothetical protein